MGLSQLFLKNLQKVVDICKKCSKIEKVVEAWLSLVERYIRDVEVASSNLVASIGQTGNVGNGIFGSFCTPNRCDKTPSSTGGR